MTFCALEKHCTVYDRVQNISGLSYGNPLCEGCRNRCVSDLNFLRYDFVDLSQILVPGDARSEAQIFRPKPESSPPIDMRAYGLREDIHSVLTATEDAVRQLRQERPRITAGVRQGYAVDQAVRYLCDRVQDIADTSYVWAREINGEPLHGADVLTEFGRLHGKARALLGLADLSVGLAGACPYCAVPALRRREPDDGKVWCGRCRKVMARSDYDDWLRMQFPPVTGELPGRSS